MLFIPKLFTLHYKHTLGLGKMLSLRMMCMQLPYRESQVISSSMVMLRMQPYAIVSCFLSPLSLFLTRTHACTDIWCMKLARRKHPNCLADSWKHKLDGCRFKAVLVQSFSILYASFFKYVWQLYNIFEQAVGPSVHQTFSLWPVKPNKWIKNKNRLY